MAAVWPTPRDRARVRSAHLTTEADAYRNSVVQAVAQRASRVRIGHSVVLLRHRARPSPGQGRALG
jgi:hypothetical protein